MFIILGLLNDFIIDLRYDLVFYSEPFRLIKNTRICSFSVSPKDETTISIILTDGKVLFWNFNHQILLKQSNMEINNEEDNGYRMPLNGVMFALPSGPYVIHMCPPMTVKNWKEWQPLLAVGKLDLKFFFFFYSLKAVL